MLTMKKTLQTAGAVLGLASAMSANAIVVGGIDFGTALGLSHLESATLAQTFITGNNQNATAYGSILSVNGDTTYCAGGGSCSLYYVAEFGGSQNFTGTYVEFLTATITVYYSSSVLNLLSSTSPDNIATIEGMTPWLTLTGHGNLGDGTDPLAQLRGSGLLTGGTLAGAGFGLFDVDTTGPGLAEVIEAFNTSTVPDAAGGFADVALNSSFNNFVLSDADNAAGLTTGCANGTATVGAWCYQGTSNLRGTLQEVPEPGTLALAGLGFGVVGMMASRRRKIARK